jgi:hypothetical protein
LSVDGKLSAQTAWNAWQQIVATFRPSTKLLFIERDKECEVTDKETAVIQEAGNMNVRVSQFQHVL